MLVGHIGVGLAAKALEPRMKLGTMLAAALLLDIIFFLLMLTGAESAFVPRDKYLGGLSYDFPFSHSLLSTVLLAVVAALAWALWGGRRARRHGAYWDGIALVAAAVFSHWLLDLLVHSDDLPLYPGGVGLGLGLARHQPAALILELALAALGFTAFALRSHIHWGRKLVVGLIVCVAASLAIEGAYGPMPVSDASVIALFSLGFITVVIALAAWADSSKGGRLTRLTG